MDRYLFSKFVAIFAGVLCITFAVLYNFSNSYIISGSIFGTTWSINAEKRINKSDVEKILSDIDIMASNYKYNSEINFLNRGLIKDNIVSDDLHEILKIAYKIQNQNEAYKIGFGHLSASNGFAPVFDEMPNPNLADGKWSINNDKSINVGKNTWLDLSSIAKGYADQKIHEYLLSKNHKNYLIDIGGELIVNGKNNKNTWKIAIQDPNQFQNSDIYIIESSNFLSIATSGEYRNFLINEGKKISHTIKQNSTNNNDISVLSVTVINNYNATEADAYATALNAQTYPESFIFAEKYNIAAMFIINDYDEISIIKTKKWYDLVP